MSSQGLVSVSVAVAAAAAASSAVSAVALVVSAAAVVASAVNPEGTAGTAGTAAGERSGRDQLPWQLVGLLPGHMETGFPFHTVVGSIPLFGPL